MEQRKNVCQFLLLERRKKNVFPPQTAFSALKNHDPKSVLSTYVLNPYCTTVLIQERQNHVVLQTFYLKNGRELDRNIQSLFKVEEISYNMSKF